MKIAIIQFPGSNCESESIRAIKQAGMEPIEFLWNEDYSKLKEFDGYFIVGGFSYEDRSRSGIISALDPLIPHLKIEAQKDKPVLGICNGAQILVETGMVPGLIDDKVGIALAVNKRVKDGKILGTGFYNTWVNVQSSNSTGSCAFNKNFKQGEFMHIPIAHGEGRFIIPAPLLTEIKNNQQDVFRYCDDKGNLHDEFPINPNGSVESLAAVCNTSGNVMAMMPHPERTSAGQQIFTSIRDYIQENKTINLKTLSFQPEKPTIQTYQVTPGAIEMLVELVITDNEAKTVQNTLKNLGADVKLKKYAHWEINTDSAETIEKIKQSGELFNSNKEKLTTLDKPLNHSTIKPVNFLVRYKDDFVGQSKKATLIERFGIENLKEIKRGTLWQIIPEHGNIDEVAKFVLDSGILYNQFSQECLKY